MEIVTSTSPNKHHQEASIKVFKGIEEVPAVDTLEELIEKLRMVFESDSVNIEYVYALMTSYKSKPSDWKKFAKFDRYRLRVESPNLPGQAIVTSKSCIENILLEDWKYNDRETKTKLIRLFQQGKKYTRNLVDSGNGKYNLMVLCWGEGHGSAIHDHANSHCFMKMLQGSLREVRFAWPESENEEMKEIGSKELALNSVCYINDSIGLHRVENVSNVEGAVSLHLYSPPYDKCTVFNQNTGQKSNAHVTFWSVHGERRNRDIQTRREPEDN